MKAKKIVALAMMLVLVLGLSATAFACDDCPCCGCKTENECHGTVAAQTNCGQSKTKNCEIKVLKNPYSEPNVPYGTPTSFLVSFDKYDWIEWEVMSPEGGIMPIADVLTWGWELYGYDSTKLVVHYATYSMSGYKFRAVAHYGECCKATSWASLTVVENCCQQSAVCVVPVCPATTPVCTTVVPVCQTVAPACAPVTVATGTYSYSEQTQVTTNFSTTGSYFTIG